MARLKRCFFERETLTVARELLGARLIRENNDSRISGIIVEVEAYKGWHDAASHAHRGKTPRTQVMFGKAGYSYIYLIYGMYWLLNVVAKPPNIDYGAAILLRALEPVEGLDIIAQRRTGRKAPEWTNGPGKLTLSMDIDDRLNNIDITTGHSPIYFEEGEITNHQVRCGPRIGINVPEPWKGIPWRFWTEPQNATTRNTNGGDK